MRYFLRLFLILENKIPYKSIIIRYYELKSKFFSVSYATRIKWTIICLFGLLGLFISFSKNHIFSIFDTNKFGPSAFLSLSIFSFDFIILLIFLLFFIRAFLLHEKQEINKSVKVPIISIFFFAFLLFLPHETYNFTWNQWFIARFFESIAILFILLVVDSHEAIFFGISAGGAIQAVIAFAQFIKQGSVGLRFLGEPLLSKTINGIARVDILGGKVLRPYGTFGHPNELAAYLIVSCATSFYFFLTKKGNTKIFSAIALALSVAGEFLTFSRTGIFALFILFGISFYTLYKNKLRNSLFMGLKIILISIAAISIIILPELNSRISFNDRAAADRGYYNQIGLEIFKLHPIFGSGAGNIIFKVAEQLPINAYSWQVQPPHNYFLLVACETGIIGLILILIFFAKIFIDLFKKIKLSSRDSSNQIYLIILFAIFVSFIFLMQFDHYFYTWPQTQLLLWMVLGMICGAIYKNNQV